MYNIVATVKISVEDEKVKNTLLKALLPEVKVLISSRARVYCKSTNKSLLLTFQAIDLTGLRAVINSFLRLVYSIERILIIVHNK